MRLKITRYGIVGIITLIVQLSACAILSKMGMTIAWLAPLAFTAAVVVNYVLQKVWVFSDKRPVAFSLPKYLVMISVGYVINSYTMLTLIPTTPLLLAQLVAVILVVFSNALFAFLWVFAIKKEYK